MQVRDRTSRRIKIDVIALVTAAAGLLTAATSLALAILMSSQNIEAEHLNAANTFLTLRERYYRIDEQLRGLPVARVEKGSKEWPIVRRYWYQVFDEWYVVKRIEKRNELWSDFYEDVIDASLGNVTLGPVLCDLRESELARGLRKEFVDELAELRHRRNPKEVLCAHN
jgi:hypothetical protein